MPGSDIREILVEMSHVENDGDDRLLERKSLTLFDLYYNTYRYNKYM